MTNPNKFSAFLLSCFLASSFITTPVAAKVSPEEAAKLDGQLTPTGGMRAGNIEGTIPAWSGGITEPPKEYKKGGNYIDPFAADSIMFSITPDNFNTVKDKLTTGHQALFKAYPSYKMHIYPTHRSASYSKEVYQALKKNALEAELLPRSAGVKNGKLTSPFPIANSAEEMLWNHTLRYRGKRFTVRVANAAVTDGGNYNPVIFDRSFFVIYAQPELDSRRLENKFFFLKFVTVAPPKQAGNISLLHESIDQVASPRKAWQYFAGQRRLRRSPNLSYDSYITESDSLRTVDQFDMFNGAPDQYDWEIIGKKELYVPYNAYKLNDSALTVDDIIRPKHTNQEHARYELHRVWVVEGKLRVGISHIYGKRVIYLDEDSWQALVTEEYDKEGKLWRVQEGHAMNYYDQPLVTTAIENTYDLQSGRYFIDGLDNEYGPFSFDADLDAREFSTSSVRREAKR